MVRCDYGNKGKSEDSGSYRILIVTETYAFGGLETHLYGKMKHLSDNGHELFLVTGTSFIEENLPSSFCKKIFTGVDLSATATAQRAVAAMQRLVDIIREYKIDLVDIHPFFSIIPAFFSACLTNTPFVYTVHGPASLIVNFNQLFEWFGKYVLLPNASLVHNVSKETWLLTKNYVDDDRNAIFKNGVNTTLFCPEESRASFDKCCIVSRLEGDKVNGIKAFIALAYQSSIKQIDIYGDGPEYNHLKEWIQSTNADNTVTIELKGVHFRMNEVYKHYDVVAGMGRVVLEALAVNKPVILVGYDGVKGLLDNELTEKASNNNFSGRGLQNIDSDGLNQQLESLHRDYRPYRMAAWIRENADEQAIWEEYSIRLRELKPIQTDIVWDVYHCFLNHTSTTPYIWDYDLLAKIRDILRSNKYINSNSCRFMSDYDQRSFYHSVNDHLERVEASISTLNEQASALSEKQAEVQGLHQELQQTRVLLEQKTVLQQQLSEQNQLLESRTAAQAQEITQQASALSEKQAAVQGLQQELQQTRVLLEQKTVLHQQLSEQKQVLESRTAAQAQEIDQLRSAQTNANQSLSSYRKELEKAKVQAGIKTLLEEEMEEKELLIGSLKQDLQEQLQRQNELMESIRRQEAHIDKLQKDVEWFSATYEKRSVLGILKEKAAGSIAKKDS